MVIQVPLQIGSRSFKSMNLWRQARDSLDEGLKATLDINDSFKTHIVERTLETAVLKRQLCLRRRWKFERHGRQVIVRDLLEKIIKWLNYFKAARGRAVQSGQSQSSFPWGVIRLVLQAAISERKVFGSTIENLEIVCRIVTRYASIEDGYARGNAEANEELESYLITLYAEVLTLLAKAKKFFETPLAVRSLHRVFQLEEDEQMEVIKDQENRLSAVISRSDTSFSTRFYDLERPINRSADQLAIYEKTEEATQYYEILNWLSSGQYTVPHERVTEGRLPLMGKWLLSHAEYLKWVSSSESSMLLIHGPAGCGKTALASIAIESFKQETSGQQQPSAPCAYFYCTKSKSEPERSDSRNILGSIVRQLSTNSNHKSIHSSVYNRYKCQKNEAESKGLRIRRPTVKNYADSILEIVGSDPAAIVIDGLDELDQDERYELISSLKTICDKSDNVFKVLLTCCGEGQILTLVKDFPQIQIDKHLNQEDMKIFVHYHTSMAIQSHSLNGQSLLRQQEHLEEMLLRSAGEQFLLAKLLLDKLCEETFTYHDDGEAMIYQAIQQLSNRNLETLYQEAYNTISSASTSACDIAKQTFAILLYQREPLTANACLAALNYAEPTSTGKLTLSELLKFCKNLVVLDVYSNTLRFVHASAQKFLGNQPDILASQANEWIAYMCIRACVHVPMIDSSLDLCPTEHFHQYSVLHWAEHLREAGKLSQTSKLKILSHDFICGELSHSFMSWITIAQQYSKSLAPHHALKTLLATVSSSSSTPLFTVSAFGLLHVFQTLAASNSFEWNQKNDEGHTALYLACAFGHDKLAELLLHYGTDPNITCGEYGNALQAACFEGYDTIVEMLLRSGASQTSPGKFKHALQASIVGRNQDIALLILNKDFHVNNQDTYDEILLEAAQRGLVRVVQHIQRSYRPYCQSKPGLCNAINSAIFEGELSAVQVMAHIQDPTIALPIDSVSTAVLGCQNQAVIFFLEKGMDIEQSGEFGRPLRAASIMGDVSIVQTLVNRGADVTALEPFGSALHAAAMLGHFAVTKLLLDEGADPNADGGLYGRPLLAATHQGHVDIVIALLDGGANPNHRGLFKNALHAAVKGGHEQLVLLFLKRGLRFNSPVFPHANICNLGAHNSRPNYNSFLRDASPRGRGRSKTLYDNLDEILHPPCTIAHAIPAQIRMNLAQIRSYVEFERPYRMNDEFSLLEALRIAVSKGRTELTKMLLEKWSFLTGEDLPNVDNMIGIASRNGHAQIVELLIMIRRSSFHGKLRPLVDAVSRGRQVIPRILMEGLAHNGPHMQSSDDSWRRPFAEIDWMYKITGEIKQQFEFFLAACIAEDTTTVLGLLESMNRVFSATEALNIQHEALNYAAVYGSETIMQLLTDNISFEADVLKKAFKTCCSHGNHETALFLLRSSKGYLFGEAEITAGITSATENGFLNTLRALLQLPAHHESFQALLDDLINISSRKGHAQIVAFLLDENANPNALIKGPGRETSSAILEGQKRTSLQAAFEGWCYQGDYVYNPPVKNKPEGSREQREETILVLLRHKMVVFSSYEASIPLLRVALCYFSAKVIEDMIASGAPVTSPLVGSVESTNDKNTSSTILEDYENLTAVSLAMEDYVFRNAYDMDLRSTTTRQAKSLLELAAGREFESNRVIKVLLRAGARFPDGNGTINPVLNSALRFFRGNREHDCFLAHRSSYSLVPPKRPESIQEVLQNGPGACIRILLENLPFERTDKEDYDLLLQMAIVAKDYDYIELLISRGININPSGFYYGNPLQCAARIGDVQLVETLLDLGAEINKLGGRHDTALQSAVAGGHTQVVNLLLKRGAYVNLRTLEEDDRDKDCAVKRGNMHPLVNACALGNLTMVKLLIEYGADVHAAPAIGKNKYMSIEAQETSALHMACTKGYEAIASVLIDNGADMELVVEQAQYNYRNYQTPLQLAAVLGNAAIVRLLIQRGAKIDRCDFEGTTLSIASDLGKVHVVKELLRYGASIKASESRKNALVSACLSHRRRIVSLLLDSLRGTEDAQSVFADAVPIAAQDKEIFRLFLESVPIAASLFLARTCITGLKENVRKLLDLGIDPDSDDDILPRPLHIAAFHQKGKVLELLLERTGDPNKETVEYGNPLQAALEGYLQYMTDYSQMMFYFRNKYRQLAPKSGFTDKVFSINSNYRPGTVYENEPRLSECERIVELLLDKGVEVNPRFRNLGIPLHAASFIGSVSIVQRLLSHGADLNTTSDRFGTALIAAIDGNNIEVADLLLDHGVDINYVSPGQGSALHRACASCNYKAVRMLRDRGADLDVIGGPYGTLIDALSSFNWSDSTKIGDREAIKKLLERQPEPPVQDQDVLASERTQMDKLNGEKMIVLSLLRE